MITVVVLVGTKRLHVGTYTDPVIAEAVAASWAKWSGCKAAILERRGSPPLILIRPQQVPVATTS